MKKAKPKYSFRLDEHLVEQAKLQNINLAKLIEATIAKAINDKRCPYCGKSN